MDGGQDGGPSVGTRHRRVVARRVQTSLEEVLHGLDVVAGDGFDLGQLGDLGRAEGIDGPAQIGLLGFGQARGAGQDVVVRQVDEPLDLDGQAGPIEGGLRQVVDQWCGHGAVAAVERAQGDGGGDGGEVDHGVHYGGGADRRLAGERSAGCGRWSRTGSRLMPGSARAIDAGPPRSADVSKSATKDLFCTMLRTADR